MESIYHSIGGKIRELRLHRGLTQQQLAEKAGISVSFLSFLEKGDRKGSLQTYADLATAFGMELSELFQNSGKRKLPAAEPFPQLTVAETQAVYQLVKTLRKKRR